MEGFPTRLIYRDEGKRAGCLVRLEIEAPAAPAFRIARKGPLAALALVEPQDVSVGEPGFDSAFVVQGQDAGFLRRLLDEQRRDWLLGFAGGLEIDAREEGFRLEASSLPRARATAVVREFADFFRRARATRG